MASAGSIQYVTWESPSIEAFKPACAAREIQHTEQMSLLVFLFLSEAGYVLGSTISACMCVHLGP